MLKKSAKSLIVCILGWQTRRLLKRNDLKVIAVVGSMGKTSTKLAIAHYLKHHFKVQYQDGNYNDITTVPLVFFGQTSPPRLTNPLAWLKVIWQNQRQLKHAYPYDIVVLELGTDGPGQIQAFKRYLRVDIAVITAIAPEHMEFFKTLDAVATEELAVSDFSKQLLANEDLCAGYLSSLPSVQTYGLTNGDFYLSEHSFSGHDYSIEISQGETQLAKTTYEGLADTELYCVLAAVAVGQQLGFPAEKIAGAISDIQPAAGRMRRLKGIKDSLILDDTYNASPEATKAALATLYKLEAPQRIAILGNMNELGEVSETLHREVGEYCDPTKLSLVVTLGPDANALLAPTAAAKGCQVQTANTPYEAAELVKNALVEGAIILAKGSQNGVFAEEAVKQLLADPADSTQLVRQSDTWLKTKAKQFKPPSSKV